MHSTANVPIPALNGMALGFYQHNVNGHRVIAHGGDTNAFHSDLHLFMDDGTSACTYRSTAAARKAQRRRFARRSSISSRIAISPLLQPRSPRSTLRPLGPMRSYSLAAGAVRAVPSLALSRSPTCLGRPKSAWIKTERCTPRWRKFSAFAHSNGFRLDRCCGATPTVTKCSARKSRRKGDQLSINSIAPIMVMLPTPWYLNAAWLLPALYASLAVFALRSFSGPLEPSYGVAWARTFALEGKRPESVSLEPHCGRRHPWRPSRLAGRGFPDVRGRQLRRRDGCDRHGAGKW